MPSDPLALAAAFGSVSYGAIQPERLRALLLGEAAPEAGEKARLRQAAAETDPNTLAALALALGLTSSGLCGRFEQLIGEKPEEINPWLRGDLF